jgi:hypothetical protein
MTLVKLHRDQQLFSLDLPLCRCNDSECSLPVACQVAWGIVLNAFEPSDRVQFGLIQLDTSTAGSTKPKITSCALTVDMDCPVSQLAREISICQESGLGQIDTIIVQSTRSGTESPFDLKALSDKEKTTEVRSCVSDM